jgi:hypothetical protein
MGSKGTSRGGGGIGEVEEQEQEHKIAAKTKRVREKIQELLTGNSKKLKV